MALISGLSCRLRSYLVERLGQLNTTLSDMSQRVRTTIATHVAGNIAGVVQDLVESTITPPVSPRMRFFDSASWRARDESMRSSPRMDPRSELFGYQDEPDQEDYEPQPPAPRQQPRLRMALVTGLRAGTWCLCRRNSGSFLTALAIGISAGAMALFGGPMLAAGAATVCSLLALTG
jgi:hypothetical protein